VTVVRDTSKFIRESVDDVVNSLVLGGLLTILIVFLFLNSWRSTVITGLTLPISVISSFIVMNFMGMTLNMLTLMALSLSIGMLIDDAIVVRENIVRHLEMGKDHFSAAREGTAEIGLAVLATSLSIVAVFVPVAFMKGIVGRFFFSFGITVAWAVLVSLLVSFTLDPMLSSRWVDPSIGRHGTRNPLERFLDAFNDWFNRGAERYRGVIAWALDHRAIVLVLAVGAFVAGIFVFGKLESSFIPEQDRGEFQVQFQSAPDASIEETRARLEQVVAILKAIPEVEHTYGTIGASDTTVRDALVYVRLKERNLRTRSQKQIQRQVRDRLADVAGVRTAIIKAGDLFNGKELMVNVQGDDLAVLKRTAGELKEKVQEIPGIVDVGMTLQDDIPEYRFTVDRRKAADLGLTTAVLVRTVGTLVGGTPVTTWENEEGDAVQVRLRLPAALRENPEQIGRLRLAVPGANGRVRLVPLGEVLKWEVQTTPSQIARQDLSRQVVIGANLDGIPIGTAVGQVKKAAATMTLPPGYKVSFSGEAEDMAESFGYMGEALLLAVLLVYLILAAQFESFLDPLAIMTSLPLAIVGVAGTLLLTRDTISIMSFIGLIMLMGLVTKNAILLVAYAKTLREGGMARREALISAGRTRLRPILMTTSAMIFGMLPMALGLGAGAEMRAPMARAVTGGLITSTVLTLLVVPVVYTLFDDFEAWIIRRWSGTGQAHS
jgi:HAE1 family hydrophobic/amphiphilic exporter-1